MWTLTNLRPSPRSNWNLEVLVFVEGGKPENPEKNPWSKARTKNKLNPHETASTGIELGPQRWEASAYPLRHPCRINPSRFIQQKPEISAGIDESSWLAQLQLGQTFFFVTGILWSKSVVFNLIFYLFTFANK